MILGFGVRAATPPKPTEVGALMQKKLTHAQKLLEGIALGDLNKVGDNAKELALLSKQLEFMVLKTPEYGLHANDFRRALEDIQRSVKQKNLDAATLGYMDLTMSCVRCHKYVREVRIAERLRQSETNKTNRAGAVSLRVRHRLALILGSCSLRAGVVPVSIDTSSNGLTRTFC